MNANFYINTSDNRYLDKVLLNIATNINLVFKDDVSIFKPVLITDYNDVLIPCNYIYLEDLHRYYFIDNMTLSQQKMIFNCTCDVLSSYKNDIRNLNCVIKRQENVYNTYLNDEKFKAYEYSRIQTLEFPNGFTQQAFILAIAGGGD